MQHQPQQKITDTFHEKLTMIEKVDAEEITSRDKKRVDDCLEEALAEVV